MKVIHKFPFSINDRVSFEMPIGAEILCVQTQRETPCIWALVDDRASKELRRFRVFGTGSPIDGEPGRYVGTFQMMNGNLVWHVFEVSR